MAGPAASCRRSSAPAAAAAASGGEVAGAQATAAAAAAAAQNAPQTAAAATAAAAQSARAGSGPAAAAGPPLIARFGLNLPAEGETVPLGWDVQGTGTVTVRREGDPAAVSGAFHTVERVEYTLEAQNETGRDQRSLTVYYIRPPAIRAFAVDGPAGGADGALQLSWAAERGDRVFLDGQPVEPATTNAARALVPDRDYELRVENLAGEARQVLRITATPAPTPTPAPTATPAPAPARARPDRCSSRRPPSSRRSRSRRRRRRRSRPPRRGRRPGAARPAGRARSPPASPCAATASGSTSPSSPPPSPGRPAPRGRAG